MAVRRKSEHRRVAPQASDASATSDSPPQKMTPPADSLSPAGHPAIAEQYARPRASFRDKNRKLNLRAITARKAADDAARTSDPPQLRARVQSLLVGSHEKNLDSVRGRCMKRNQSQSPAPGKAKVSAAGAMEAYSVWQKRERYVTQPAPPQNWSRYIDSRLKQFVSR